MNLVDLVNEVTGVKGVPSGPDSPDEPVQETITTVGDFLSNFPWLKQKAQNLSLNRLFSTDDRIEHFKRRNRAADDVTMTPATPEQPIPLIKETPMPAEEKLMVTLFGGLRTRFKQAARERGVTMGQALTALITLFVERPDALTVDVKKGYRRVTRRIPFGL